MKRRILTAAICVLVILAGAASLSSPADGSSPEAYQERQRALIEGYLRDPHWRTVYDADLGVLLPEGTIPSFRNTAYLALMMLELPELVRELGYDPVLEVSKMIERMIASQWTTPDEDITAYPNIIYGSYIYPGWLPEDQWPVPRSKYEYDMFVPPPLIYILREHGQLLPDSLRERLRESLRIAVDGVLKGWYALRFTSMSPGQAEEYWGHDNYTLMYIEILLLGGEVTGYPEAVEAGREAFRRWRELVLTRGMHEYSSPTYYGVDLDALGHIASFAEDPAIRGAAEAMWQYLWTDMACAVTNHNLLGAVMDGAHSRSYSPLIPYGPVYLYLAGLQPEPRWGKARDVRAATTAIQPYPEIVELITARQYPFSAFVLWDEGPAEDRTFWSDFGVTIGSAGRLYGKQDRAFAITYNTSKSLPSVIFVADAGDGGLARGVGIGHLPYAYLAAQSGSSVAMIVGDSPALPYSTRMLWHIPAQADSFWINERRLPPLRPGRVTRESLAVGDWLIWKVGAIWTALLCAASSEPQGVFLFNGEKNELGTYTAQVYFGEPTTSRLDRWGAFFITTASAEGFTMEEEFLAALRNTEIEVTKAGDVVSLSVRSALAEGPLLVALDLAQDVPLERYPGGVDGAAGKPILQANNVSVDDGGLTVNGRSIVLGLPLSADDGEGHGSDYGP